MFISIPITKDHAVAENAKETVAYMIGHYSPTGKFIRLSTMNNLPDTVNLIHYLNGGSLIKNRKGWSRK